MLYCSRRVASSSWLMFRRKKNVLLTVTVTSQVAVAPGRSVTVACSVKVVSVVTSGAVHAVIAAFGALNLPEGVAGMS